VSATEESVGFEGAGVPGLNQHKIGAQEDGSDGEFTIGTKESVLDFSIQLIADLRIALAGGLVNYLYPNCDLLNFNSLATRKKKLLD